MTPERLGRIRAIYEAALQIESAEIEVFLERECGSDSDCERRVKRLLAARENIPEWLSKPLLGHAERIIDSVRAFDGKELRGYRLIREVGHGGMGSVYLAERADGAYTKQVAVKLIRAGQDSAEIVARFQREREILASLDHPNIARLIDGGNTDEGAPYFVMEFVDGRPIHEWCDEHKLNVSQRIELFRQVCDAVRYAHQRLVVHRDLKPGNILVTADGTVKLLDFGIAKVVAQAPMGDLSETVTMSRLMTPEYASPEQIKGEAITTLTDVYSLGVVLYELLTGHQPYQLLKAALHEIARVILEEEPTRPSDVVTTTQPGAEGEPGPQTVTPESVSEVREGDPQRLRKRLKGDLDCILLTTLHKEPSRRYRSVESLSDDLQRHLENRPVSAREDSVWYRISRFIRRHPVGLTAGILIGVSVIVGVLATQWEMRIALDAGSQRLSGRTIFAPQLMLDLWFGLPVLVGVAWLFRPRLRRAAGALAGGTLSVAVWILRLRLDYTMGWWRSRFVESPDPLSLMSPALVFIPVTLYAAIPLVVSWRAARRFGWPGLAVWILGISVIGTFEERWGWDTYMRLMTLSGGMEAMLTNIALTALGLALGHSLMRIVSGPSKADALSRTADRRQ